MQEIKLGKYEHYKGNRYEVIGIAEHTETAVKLVVYRPLYGEKEKLWARPLTIFSEEVEVNGTFIPRFRFITQ